MSEAAAFLARLDAVEGRLRRHAAAPPPPGLTDPDPPTGERWDWGQVWAHLAEFVPYWMGQLRAVLEAGEPVRFGRVKTDPQRVAAIERDRHRPPQELLARLEAHLVEVRQFLSGLTEEDWGRRGIHPTLGEMTVPRIVDAFLVGHLEEHADQLDGLLRAAAGPG